MLRVNRPLAQVFALLEQRTVARVIVFLNLIGFAAGTAYWYGPHFLQGKGGLGSPSPLLWIFIPDCPLFALLFVIAWAGLRRGKPWTWFYAITAIGLLKYGVWTVTFWFSYWALGASLTLEGIVMTVAHLGMILQGIFLLTRLHAEVRHALIALAWFTLSDFVDYGLGEYPFFYPTVPLWLMQWHTIIMTWLLSGWLALLAMRQAPAPHATHVSSSSS